MVLSDVDIRRYLAEGRIKITPELPPEQFGSCSVDFRLGGEFNVFQHSRHAFIDLREKRAIEDLMEPVNVVGGEPFILQPREFVLAITEECISNSPTTFSGGWKAAQAWGASGLLCMGLQAFSTRAGPAKRRWS
jgi:dCTP deaminase